MLVANADPVLIVAVMILWLGSLWLSQPNR
jgi:hypothetical protein